MRAQRFPLHAPVRYRADDGGWLIGTTENISRTGLLLHVDETRAVEPLERTARWVTGEPPETFPFGV